MHFGILQQVPRQPYTILPPNPSNHVTRRLFLLPPLPRLFLLPPLRRHMMPISPRPLRRASSPPPVTAKRPPHDPHCRPGSGPSSRAGNRAGPPASTEPRSSLLGSQRWKALHHEPPTPTPAASFFAKKASTWLREGRARPDSERAPDGAHPTHGDPLAISTALARRPQHRGYRIPDPRACHARARRR